jgi:hypothetical protein
VAFGGEKVLTARPVPCPCIVAAYTSVAGCVRVSVYVALSVREYVNVYPGAKVCVCSGNCMLTTTVPDHGSAVVLAVPALEKATAARAAVAATARSIARVLIPVAPIA